MNNVLSLALSIFGVAGFAGGAVGYFAKGKSEAVIALSAKENRLLKDDNTRLEKALAQSIAKNTQLEAENKRVWDKAQGSAQLVSLTSAVKDLVEYIKRSKDNK